MVHEGKMAALMACFQCHSQPL